VPQVKNKFPVKKTCTYVLACTPRLSHGAALPESLNSILINRRRHLKEHSLEIHRSRHLAPEQQEGQEVD